MLDLIMGGRKQGMALILLLTGLLAAQPLLALD
jgi:hypothetical protein